MDKNIGRHVVCEYAVQPCFGIGQCIAENGWKSPRARQNADLLIVTGKLDGAEIGWLAALAAGVGVGIGAGGDVCGAP